MTREEFDNMDDDEAREAFADLMADRDRRRKIMEVQDIQIANQAQTLKEMNRQIEMRRENNFGLHSRNVRLAAELSAAKTTLAKWIKWARMHGHLEHAGGIVDESRRALDSQNDLVEARRNGAPPSQ